MQGAMRRGLRAALVVAMGASAWACTHARDVVRTRAAREGNCPESQLQVEELGAGAFRVTGCGPETTYVCSPSGTVIGSGSSIICTKEGSALLPGSAAPPAPAAR